MHSPSQFGFIKLLIYNCVLKLDIWTYDGHLEKRTIFFLVEIISCTHVLPSVLEFQNFKTCVCDESWTFGHMDLHYFFNSLLNIIL